MQTKKTHGIEKQNDTMRIHDNEVNKIFEYDLLHDIINNHKRTKKLNSHYFPIINECMNTRKGRQKCKNFRILLNSVCNSMIVMGRLVEKYILKKMLLYSGTLRMIILLPILR